MMHLYDHPESGNCYKVRLLLSHLGLPFTRETLDVFGDRDAQRGAAFRELNPIGKIPTLVLDDGTALCESMAILWYLAEGTRFEPADRLTRARTLQWLSFEQNNIEPSIAVARFELGLEKKKPHADVVSRWQAMGHNSLATMNGYLTNRRFFVADRYGLADIALFAYTHVAGDGGFDLGAYPAVAAWFERVRQQPGFVPATQ